MFARITAVTAVVAATGAALTGTAMARTDSGSAPQRTAASQTASVKHVTLPMKISSPQLAQCYPHAKATVTVALTTDAKGKDTFTIQGSGLQPTTDFTVFLLQKAGSPFGAAEYIGDFSTDTHGRGSGTFTLIVEEAFAFNNVTGARKDLNSVGFWFADEKADDVCLGAASPVTGFDGDAHAGVQMMNSGAKLLP